MCAPKHVQPLQKKQKSRLCCTVICAILCAPATPKIVWPQEWSGAATCDRAEGCERFPLEVAITFVTFTCTMSGVSSGYRARRRVGEVRDPKRASQASRHGSEVAKRSSTRNRFGASRRTLFGDAECDALSCEVAGVGACGKKRVHG